MLNIIINYQNNLPAVTSITTGQVFPSLPWDVVSEIYANGAELTKLKSLFPTLPVYSGAAVVHYVGETAQFISVNLGGTVF